MDFGSNSDEGNSKPVQGNDEDLLLDNFYTKKQQQPNSVDIPLMPPTPATLPKQQESLQEFISSHFT
jgi:hypothetical protein